MIQKSWQAVRTLMRRLSRKKMVRGGALLLAISTAAFTLTQPASAVIQREMDYGQGNSVEQQYIRPKHQCSRSDRCYRAGVWMASPGTEYKSTIVNIPYGATTVDVEIRGSWTAQPTQDGDINRDYKGSYSNLETNPNAVHPVTGGGSSAGDNRIYGYSSGKFYRGDRLRNTNPWFIRNTDGKVSAKFNVGNICSGKEGQMTGTTVLIGSSISYTFFSRGGESAFGEANYDRTDVSISCGRNPAYSLTPQTSMNTSAIPLGSSSLNVSSSIRKTGASSGAVNDAYAILARFIVKADRVPSMQTTGGDAHGGNGSVVVQYIRDRYLDMPDKYASWNTPINYNAGEGTYQPANYAGITDDLSGLWGNVGIGDRICYVTFVNKYNLGATDTDWLGDAPRCAVVAKNPKLSITGGDVRTGDGIDTSRNMLNGNYYGSWVEYGALITRTNVYRNFASAGSMRNGLSNESSSNLLTFANSNTDANRWGNFGDPNVGASRLAAYIQKLVGSPSGSYGGGLLTDTAPGTYTAGNVTIPASTIANGKSVVINAGNNTVTIAGDITYADGATSVEQIPQVVIIARNILVQDSVRRIDAWLLAPTDTGLLETCTGRSTTQLNSSVCNQQLTVNGPITSQKARFNRTAGSDDSNPATQTQVAENLNLPASSFLWEYGRASKTSIPTTVQVTELPPRY